MDAKKDLIKKAYYHLSHDSLRRNSSFLITNQAINAAAMFLFWIICARLFSTNDIGLAAAFISLAALVATFTQLGVSNTIVRFLPTAKNKSGLFNAALAVAIVGSCIGAIAVIAFIAFLSPGLSFIRHSYTLMLIFISLVVVNAATGITDSTLISFRKGEYLAYKAIAANLPKLLVILLIVLGVEGIVFTYMTSLLIGIIYEIIVLRTKFFKRQTWSLNLLGIWEKRHFTFANYIGGMASILPTTLLPLIVLEYLGAKGAAYLYMPMQLAGFLVVIASSASQALFSEASQEESEVKNLLHLGNAFTHIYRMLIPASIGLIGIGWIILRAYGAAYETNGFWLLVLLCGASLMVAINTIGDTWLLVKKNMKGYLFMQVLNAVLVIVPVCLALQFKLGLVGLGFGWVLGQTVTAIVYALLYGRQALQSYHMHYSIKADHAIK
jgi:O-antigen/teichoic acid export membrane protein